MASETPPPPQPPSPNLSTNLRDTVLIPTILAGVVGGGVGLVSKHRTSLGVGSVCGAYAANFAIVAGCYCGMREFISDTRASGPDDLLNSVGAGIMSGAILGRLQGGQLGAVRYSLLFAIGGTAVDYATIRLRPTIEKYKSMSMPEWSIPEWSPIQVLDEEALAKKRAREQQLYAPKAFRELKKEESG